MTKIRAFVANSADIPESAVKDGRDTSVQVLIGADSAPHFAMRRFRIKPGGGMPNHANEVEHEQYVLGGNARVGIDGETFRVGKGDVLLIPAGVPHWYESLGDDDFEFLCLVPNLEDRIRMIPD